MDIHIQMQESTHNALNKISLFKENKCSIGSGPPCPHEEKHRLNSTERTLEFQCYEMLL